MTKPRITSGGAGKLKDRMKLTVIASSWTLSPAGADPGCSTVVVMRKVGDDRGVV